jgi:hypothetical protein
MPYIRYGTDCNLSRVSLMTTERSSTSITSSVVLLKSTWGGRDLNSFFGSPQSYSNCVSPDYNIAVVFLCKIIYTGTVWDRQVTKQRMET